MVLFTVKGRALVLDNQRKPWTGTLDILLCNPNGDAAERWTRLVTKHGVGEFQYQLATSTLVGQWHFTASLARLSKTISFRVEEWNRSPFELNIHPKANVISWDEVLYGSVSTMVSGKGIPVAGEVDVVGQIFPMGKLLFTKVHTSRTTYSTVLFTIFKVPQFLTIIPLMPLSTSLKGRLT